MKANRNRRLAALYDKCSICQRDAQTTQNPVICSNCGTLDQIRDLEGGP